MRHVGDVDSHFKFVTVDDSTVEGVVDVRTTWRIHGTYVQVSQVNAFLDILEIGVVGLGTVRPVIHTSSVITHGN
jgi:hypothetical protein